MPSEKDGVMIILSSPSGAGKTTLVKYLLSMFNKIEFSISATSRKPRGMEKNGKDYYFLSGTDCHNSLTSHKVTIVLEVPCLSICSDSNLISSSFFS